MEKIWKNKSFVKINSICVPYGSKSERRRMRVCAARNTNAYHTAFAQVLTDAKCAHVS